MNTIKRILWIIAFAAILAGGLFLLIKFTVYYLIGVLITLVIMFLDKPLHLSPEDSRFDAIDIKPADTDLALK